jgi:hypothetical protein
MVALRCSRILVRSCEPMPPGRSLRKPYAIKHERSFCLYPDMNPSGLEALIVVEKRHCLGESTFAIFKTGTSMAGDEERLSEYLRRSCPLI